MTSSSSAAELHAALITAMRSGSGVSGPVLDAFGRVPRDRFLPGVEPETVFRDTAIVTRTQAGVPTSSSTQPSLMARMIDRLRLEPEMRVLELGSGTGYNAAIMAQLGAAVTSVELQETVAAAAIENLRSAGITVVGDQVPAAGEVRIVIGDGSDPPVASADTLAIASCWALPDPSAASYDAAIITAGCWAVPARFASAVEEGGTLVAPLRINGLQQVVALRRDGQQFLGSGGIGCSFMPLQTPDGGPWRWRLASGAWAEADVDPATLQGSGPDALLAGAGTALDPPFGGALYPPADPAERPLDALLDLSLSGDPLIWSGSDRGDRVALYRAPGSLLALGIDGDTTLYGDDLAQKALESSLATWRNGGCPGSADLTVIVEPASQALSQDTSLPQRDAAGTSTMRRGAHRWTLGLTA